MKRLKGFRTIAFNAIMLVAAITGAQVDPETAKEFVELFAAVWAGGNALLRAITDSPVFKPAHSATTMEGPKSMTARTPLAVVATAAGLVLLLAACTPTTKQEFAGITEITVTVPENAGFPEVHYTSGREAGTLDATYERGLDGTKVTIGATGVAAFRGQEVQADYLKVRDTEAWGAAKELAPDLFQAIEKALGLL